jgi:signal transduction histidine kinase
VVQSILDNAINFTESGIISVRLEPDNKGIKVSISDTGKGIDPSVKDRLFTKFVTKSDRADGTGLGLYISKAIVMAHGGTIGAYNNERRGATFWFTIPTS